MVAAQRSMLDELIDLILRLYRETEGFAERPDEQQLWYNRGYANGIVRALDRLGYRARVEAALHPDTGDPLQEQAQLPWGKAYRHGFEIGERETGEVMGPQSARGHHSRDKENR